MNPSLVFLATLLVALPVSGQPAGDAICEPKEPTGQASLTPAGQGPLQIGEYINAQFASPHPYAGVTGRAPQLVFSQEIHHPGAAYVAPHFGRLELAPGDSVVVRSPSGDRTWRYEEFGNAGLGRHGAGGFWGIHIYGPTAIVELWSAGEGGAFGFEIDQYARGFSEQEMAAGEGPESICTGDDKLDAICYAVSEPLAYDTGRAIAKLVIAGVGACTGWLVGDEGHLITNQHCIGSQSDADNTTFEFMFEAATCGGGSSPGVIEATMATLISVSSPLDYAFLKLPTNVTPTYGFLQLRETGAVLEERIYSIQHAGGRDKEIAIVSTYPENPSGFAEVDSVTEVGCSGPDDDTGYFMDTEGGSSGSPVLGWSDNCVVSLHHCRGSGFCTSGDDPPDDPNRGVPIQLVIADIGAENFPDSAFCGPEIFDDGFESGDTSAW